MDILLRARVASLEDELVRARFDKAAADASAQYLLRHLAALSGSQVIASNSCGQTVSQLRTEIISLKRKTAKLQAKLTSLRLCHHRLLRSRSSAKSSEDCFRYPRSERGREVLVRGSDPKDENEPLRTSAQEPVVSNLLDEDAEDAVSLLGSNLTAVDLSSRRPAAMLAEIRDQRNSSLISSESAAAFEQNSYERNPQPGNLDEAARHSSTSYVHYFARSGLDYPSQPQTNGESSRGDDQSEVCISVKATLATSQLASLSHRDREEPTESYRAELPAGHTSDEERQRGAESEAEHAPSLPLAASKLVQSSSDNAGNALQSQSTACSGLPDFFRYGIQYNPPEGDSTAYRTVMITNLPTDTSLNSLLDRVRGGLVVSATVLDSRSITNSLSAIVVFLEASAAASYANFACTHEIRFSGRVAKVTRLSKATWPMPMLLQKAISEGNSTRCIELLCMPGTLSETQLRCDLQLHHLKIDMVEKIQVDDTGVILISFASVEAAGHANGLLESLPQYQSVRRRFVSDPCAAPLETLQVNGV